MELLVQLVHAANAASRVVASTLHLCLCLTYAAHLYRHRRDWARGPILNTLRSLFLFPLMGGHRHTIFQVFAWGLWTLSAGITLPVYLSLLAADSRSFAATGLRNALLDFLGLRKPLIPLTHLDAASGAAAVSGLWGELFMLKALLVFEGGARFGEHGRDHKRQRSWQEKDIQDMVAADESTSGKPVVHDEEHRNRKQLVEGSLASLLVFVMGLALSVTGSVLLLALEHLPDTATGVLYCCLALSCISIGASSTHGLGGYLRHCAGAASSAGAAVLRGGASAAAAAATVAAGAMHGGSSGGGGSSSSSRVQSGGSADVAGAAAAADQEDEADVAPSWRFFQPFQGGSVFVATQAIGWTLFSSTVVAVLLLAKELVAGMGYCMRCWALAAGALMMATQLVLGISVLTYQNHRQARKLLQPMLHHPGASFARAAGLVMPVVMMYLPLHVSCSCMAAVFTLLPPGQATAVVLAVLLPYFAITLRGHPAHSGCRRWEWLCRWFSREVEGSLAWWAGRLVVIRDFPGTAHQVADELEGTCDKQQHHHHHQQQQQDMGTSMNSPGQTRRYVLGFHPHGLYPTGAGFLPLMPSIQAAFPGLTLVTLTASIVHYMPGLREIAGWAGFRQVTRATFRRALRDTGAVLLCPGGQAELVYADRAFPRRGTPAAAAAAAFTATAATLKLNLGGALPLSKPADAAAPATSVAPNTVTDPEVCPAGAPVIAAVAAEVTAPVPRPTGRQLQPRHQLVIFAGHQGFVRLALEEGAWLVPVLALGETLQLRNLISAPEMQRATYKRLGFPVPFILAGRWGLTTLPLRNPLIYVTGRPLQPPAGWEVERRRQLTGLQSCAAPAGEGGDAPGESRTTGLVAAPTALAGSRQRHWRYWSPQGGANHHAGTPIGAPRTHGGGGGSSEQGMVIVPQSLVDEYHCRFYAAMAALWQRYHDQHPVLRHAELLLEWGKHGPPPDFERYRRQAEEDQAARNDAVVAAAL
ncbi:hypothetical protein VaNZ11_012560 [Volvox africanus]|uniref:Diacylglycerol O-acyltransferase n=1 Tax=Volvox africanus TaxID=51714 RepID=A0ABQ5SEY9_9CHLO|nr:hypothetical protein VaNZ11_012560 [Volvox africanus]